jgi:hypothetical protein
MAPHTVCADKLAGPHVGIVSVYDSLTLWWSGAVRSETKTKRVCRGGVEVVKLTAVGLSNGTWCSVWTRVW